HTDVAPYPIVEPWEKNTKKTTEGIAAALPATTNRYEGKKLADIAADGIYRSDGTQVTTMGTNGMLHVNYTIAGTTGSLDLPITDMDTLAYDFTWGKVVLPFVNEIDGWTRDYSKICTGWKITAVIGGTTGTLTNYNFADRDCTAKDLYSNSNYIFAQGGNYIVPYGVTSIDIEANFATAYYLSDEYADFGYNATYEGPTALGWAMPATYHGQNVYTNLNTLLGDMSDSADPHSQAIVLVGNYHYNQKVISGSGVFNNYYGKALTIMSVDEDNNQEPDYGWYSYHSNPRTGIPHLRFDFVPNIGIGMAARVTGSTPNPTIGIWQCSGSFELTETCVSFMSECEIEGSTKKISTADNELGNNRYIVNSGYFIQIIRSHNEDVSNLSYLKVGGNAFIEQLYPGTHSNSAQKVKLVPIVVTGGEIKDCYMTGYRAGSVAYGPDIRFWCAGGRIHKFLGAYMDKPRQTANADGHVNMTARVDHALIRRFFGGGTSPNARITGDINVTMNNSRVDFFCGGPEFGDMASGKTVTTHATGTTFGMYYGAGFGGTSITRVRGNNASSNTDGQTEVTFSNDTDTFPLAFDNYKYLTPKTGYGIGVNYEFEFIQYAGGDGRGVARFYTGYAAFSLAQTGNIGNTLTHCTVLGNFYGGGCQGTVDGDISSTLTDCTVKGNAFAAGFQASANTLEVFPNTQPSYSVYTKETGLFSDFGTVAPDTWTWEEGAENTYNADTHTIYTSTDMDILGTVKGNTNLTIGGNSIIGTDGDATTGSVYGGGEESAVLGDTRVLLKGNALVLGNVFGGGNLGSVGGNTDVRICDECSIE
nr:hypothetical protein [Bacteroidales bacterium]